MNDGDGDPGDGDIAYVVGLDLIRARAGLDENSSTRGKRVHIIGC